MPSTNLNMPSFAPGAFRRRLSLPTALAKDNKRIVLGDAGVPVNSKTRLAARVFGVTALVFGLITLETGGAALFDLGTARAEHGPYVPFVSWFNSLSGFACIAAGVGLWLRHRWAAYLSIALVLGLLVTSIGLGVHIISGGAYDGSTLVATGIRLSVWVSITAFAWVVLLARRSWNAQMAVAPRGQL